jgi:hypothetical protein
LQWEWRFQTTSSLSLWAGLDQSSLHLSDVNDAAVDTPNDALGGPTYPYANQWWASDKQKNWTGGANLNHYFRTVRLELAWNYLSARGITSYDYASAGALTYDYTAAQAGSQFPAMTYIVNSLTLNLTVPLTERASLRFYDYWEHGQIADWHYAGFNDSLVYGNNLYTDGGPQGYNTNVVGMFFNVKL